MSDRRSFGANKNKGNRADDQAMSRFSNNSKKKANNRLTDLQILGQIDSSEDPEGQFAMTKIDFRSGGISVGNKEFGSKNEALKALEQSKTRVSEIMQ